MKNALALMFAGASLLGFDGCRDDGLPRHVRVANSTAFFIAALDACGTERDTRLHTVMTQHADDRLVVLSHQASDRITHHESVAAHETLRMALVNKADIRDTVALLSYAYDGSVLNRAGVSKFRETSRDTQTIAIDLKYGDPCEPGTFRSTIVTRAIPHQGRNSERTCSL